MARTTGPLMSMDASGSIAGTLTFSKWKGRNYVRQLVIPANPQTALQTAFRAMFGFLGSAWAAISPTDQDTWNGLADNDKISDFNAYMKINQAYWKNFLPPAQMNPPSRVLDPPTITSQAAVGGLGFATISQVIGTMADVWGVAIFRSTVTAFTAAPGNLIKMIDVTATPSWSWQDSPLAAGTYYYRLRPFTLDGKFGALGAEDPATVT